MINEQGGVNGRKINFISYDDGYSPPKTVEQVRKLVESDGVLLLFNTLGTPTNTAIHKYCNAKKVPQLFVATGATKWGDPKHFPWTMGWQPNYQSEGHIYAAYLKEHQPNGKIGVLYQNDDYGKDYVKGLKDGLGDKAKAMIVVGAALRDDRPDRRFADRQPEGGRRRRVLQCDDPEIRGAGDPQGGRDRLEAAAPAQQRIGNSVGGVLKPAGLDNVEGHRLDDFYFKDPTDPTWKDDAGYKQWSAFMDKYYPEGDKTERLQRRSAYSVGADPGARTEAVRRRSDPREHHETGGQHARTSRCRCCCRASRSIPARPISSRSSRCRWRASTARSGSCSARS